MAANELTFNQLSVILNSIVKQATGQISTVKIDMNNFASVGTTLLKSGYDPVLNAISQVLSKTIFSTRPYYGKLQGLQVSNVRYGNHVRKLTAGDSDWEDDERVNLVDGESVDQYKVKKPPVLQTNYYGQNVYSRHVTIFRDQLDVAFSSAEEFGRFISMIMTNAADQIEQAHESTRRATLLNLAAGVIAKNDTNTTIRLLTEYNTKTGQELTITDIYKTENFEPFIKFAYSRINTISDYLEERSSIYHMNVTGKTVMRHTPKRNQRLYFYSPILNDVQTSVLSSVFNKDELRIPNTENLNYWQSIVKPDTISTTPVYMAADGTLTSPSSELYTNTLLAVLIDEEAAGVTTVNEWSASSPFNASGGYSNMFWHFTDRYWNDFTENAVVFRLI